jgi:Zn-dependent protease
MFIERLFADPTYFMRYIIIIVISIVIHELAHGFAALSQGDDTPAKLGHITPNPVVHMGVASLILLCFMGMAWGQMPVNPQNFRHRWSDLWVSAAGPLSNFALGTIAALIYVLATVKGMTLISSEFFWLAANINMLLFFFNMLPVPPLDGFTVFSEVFPGLKPLRKSPIALFMLVVIWTVPAIHFMLHFLSEGTVNTIVRTLASWATPIS